jgi:A/G-specific adenine glycosylase
VSRAQAGRPASLAAWYREHGRHDLPWRRSRDRWVVLVSEVMLHQTQVTRVRPVFDGFVARFPTPAAMADAGPAAVITAWGRLGYPRRARRLWDAACVIANDGWPSDLSVLPGVGRYTARAVDAQVDDLDVTAIEVNVRRVAQRYAGTTLSDRDAEVVARRAGGRLRGRDRLLALMDLGALVCRARDPACAECPLRRQCASRGPVPGERRTGQAPYPGSFRQRRGEVLARLGAAPAETAGLDPEALASLVADGLAVHDGASARLP